MKKILILLSLILVCLIPQLTYSSSGTCNVNFDGNIDIGGSLDSCLSGSDLVSVSDSSFFGDKIKTWSNSLAVFFGILAVGAIVYGSILMVVSAGEEENIKKAKDVIKWGLIGFLGIVSASTIIVLVVNIMYSLE